MTKINILLLSIPLLLGACSSNENEDVTHEVNKNGAVESSVTVDHIDSARNVLTTTHKVWVKDTVYKTIVYRDTLPALGTTITEAENADGDKKEVAVKKDYEIYITVK